RELPKGFVDRLEQEDAYCSADGDGEPSGDPGDALRLLAHFTRSSNALFNAFIDGVAEGLYGSQEFYQAVVDLNWEVVGVFGIVFGFDGQGEFKGVKSRGYKIGGSKFLLRESSHPQLRKMFVEL